MKTKTQDFFVNSSHEQELVLSTENKKETAEILHEDISRRSENVKHFRLKNGNYRAVMYDHPVHKKDPETGELVDILPMFEEGEADYEAELKYYRVKLPRKDGVRKYVTVNKNGREFGWRYVSPKVSNRKRAEAMMSHRELDRTNPSSLPEVRYEKVDNFVTLSYRVTEGEVKESMILSQYPQTSSFRFDLKMEGLVPKVSEDGKRVLLFAEEGMMDENSVPEMVIPPANMTDANGVYTEALHYVLHEENGGTWLELVAEGEWLSAPERAYPVVIDPTVILSEVVTSNSGITMIGYCSETQTTTTTDCLSLGTDDESKVHTVYTAFDFPPEIKRHRLVKATLTLTATAASSFSLFGYPITENWNEYDLLSGEIPRKSDTYCIATCDDDKKYEFDLTNMIQMYYNNDENENKFYGVLIRADVRSDSTNQTVQVYSNLGTAYRPSIAVEYQPIDKNEILDILL